MDAIVVRGLSKTYKGNTRPALNHVSFNIEKGCIAGLLGPNGAGKSTAISILCGLTHADQGEVFINEIPQNAANRDKIKQVIGIAPQEIALFPQLSIIDNLVYFGNLYGLKGESLRKLINDYIEILELTEHTKKEVRKLSGGLKRRVNIIAGILHAPSVLVLDEPTAGVDVQSRSIIHRFLKKYNRQGKTIVYTSHLMEEAQALCDEVVIIDQGELVLQGVPAALIAANPGCKNLEDLFLLYTGHKIHAEE